MSHGKSDKSRATSQKWNDKRSKSRETFQEWQVLTSKTCLLLPDTESLVLEIICKKIVTFRDNSASCNFFRLSTSIADRQRTVKHIFVLLYVCPLKILYILLGTCYLILVTQYLLLNIGYMLLVTRYLLLDACYWMLVTGYLFLHTCYLILNTC